ncbi:protein FAR1-RELATED SEQUENCE 5-like [Salvia splendens]|uniref:protein FAR1-RELATED SEQUENCE 5-like n=1 Tax=Salvia splendens TaxID=180675 RepID=UPI001C269B31|nr:protein FAR1-RELATED SEQUENCE 5-like [Salvia splendens]
MFAASGEKSVVGEGLVESSIVVLVICVEGVKVFEEEDCDVVLVPECSPDLKPVVGQKFQSLDFTFACYEVYARAVGFDTRKQAMRKVDDVPTWYRVICNREGRKKGDEDDQLNARSDFTIKRRKLSKRCGCTASICV